MGLKEKIFAKEVVNTGRQPELDIGKAVLIFCLALVHCIIECTPEEELAYGIPFIFDSVLGGPMGAPMFIFAMGAGMAYTKHRTPADFVRRGIRIGITGYALNICRFLVPFVIGYLLTGDYEKYITPLPYRVLGNDVMQFAALAMPMTALFIKLNLSNAMMIAVSFGMSLIGTALNGLDVGNPAGNILLGYFVGTEDKAGLVISDFPLLNWLIVPVSGYVFGECLRYVKNKGLFYGILSTVGMLMTLIYFPIGIRNGWGMFGEGQNCYYHVMTTDVIMCLAVTFGMIGIYYAAAKHMSEGAIVFIAKISRNINEVYCIHWVIVVWCTNVVLYIWRGTQALSVTFTLMLGTVISIVSIGIARLWTDRKSSLVKRNKK